MPDGFACPCCQRVSYHPADLREGWCAACSWWTADTELGPLHIAAPCAARNFP